MKADLPISRARLLTPDRICDAVAKVMGVSRDGLTIRRNARDSGWSRRVAIALSYASTPLTQKELSRFFNCATSVVCRSHKQLEQQIAEGGFVVSTVAEILQEAKTERNK